MGVPEGLQRGPKRPKTAFLGHLDLVAPNWWNKVEQGWNKSGHIPGDALKQFWGSGRATRPDYGTTMAIYGHFGPFWGPIGAPQRHP